MLLISSGYEGTEEQRNALEQALKEAEDDATFKKVKRMSYSSNAAGEVNKICIQILIESKRRN